MEKFILNLEGELHHKIEELNKEANLAKRSRLAIVIIAEITNRLKTFILSHEFKCEEEEIAFFKKTKPFFFSRLLFYGKMHSIEVNKVTGDADTIINYYKKELNKLQKYVDKNTEFARYYRSDFTFLDRSFFTRRDNCELYYIDEEHYDRDPKFSTAGDFKIAQILSIDMLQIYISENISTLQEESCTNHLYAVQTKVIWTGKKNELIELIYAFNEVGCFNFGNISLNRLTLYFEQVFNVSLKNYSRDFSEMKIRNSQTPFLDKLKAYILTKMSKMNNRNNKKR